MIKCKNCGKEMQDDMMFCPECGTPVVKEKPDLDRFCPFCGTKLEPGNKYCPVCGQDVSKYNQDSNVAASNKPESFTNNNVYVGTNNQPNMQNPNTTGGYNNQPNMQDPNMYGGYNNQPNNQHPNNYGGYNNQQPYNNNYSQSYNTYGQNGYNQPNGNNYSQPYYAPPIKKEDPKIDQERIKNDKFKGYWRKPILWVISACLIVGAYFLVQYMRANPISKDAYNSSSNVDIKITGENSSQVNMINMQQNGRAFLTKDTLYIVDNSELYKIDNIKDGVDYDSKEKVKTGVYGYVTVEDKTIYYCNEKYDYYRYNTEDKKEEKLLENVFFVNKVENKLYYQKDDDKESIHVYDLETKEDKALNNEKSYNLFVDTASGYIFYSGTSDDAYNLKAMKLDGSNNIELSKKSASKFIVNDKTIYYATDKGLYKMDVSEVKTGLKETKVVDGNIFNINLYKDGFIYTLNDNEKIQYQSFDGKDKKEYYKTDYVATITVLGDSILVSNSDEQVYLVKGNDYKYLSTQSTDDNSQSSDDEEDDSSNDGEEKDIDGETQF